jgi:hypothetical protein
MSFERLRGNSLALLLAIPLFISGCNKPSSTESLPVNRAAELEERIEEKDKELKTLKEEYQNLQVQTEKDKNEYKEQLNEKDLRIAGLKKDYSSLELISLEDKRSRDYFEKKSIELEEKVKQNISKYPEVIKLKDSNAILERDLAETKRDKTNLQRNYADIDDYNIKLKQKIELEEIKAYDFNNLNKALKIKLSNEWNYLSEDKKNVFKSGYERSNVINKMFLYEIIVDPRAIYNSMTNEEKTRFNRFDTRETPFINKISFMIPIIPPNIEDLDYLHNRPNQGYITQHADKLQDWEISLKEILWFYSGKFLER